MSEITVRLRYLRQAPRKVRRMIGVIRGQTVTVALDQLTAQVLASALPIKKLLQSGVAAARDHQMDVEMLVITRAICTDGPALKRRLINSRGRSSQMKKHCSHISLTLADTGLATKQSVKRRQHGTKD